MAHPRREVEAKIVAAIRHDPAAVQMLKDVSVAAGVTDAQVLFATPDDRFVAVASRILDLLHQAGFVATYVGDQAVVLWVRALEHAGADDWEIAEGTDVGMIVDALAATHGSVTLTFDGQAVAVGLIIEGSVGASGLSE